MTKTSPPARCFSRRRVLSLRLSSARKLSPPLRPWAGTVGTPTASPSTRINSKPTPRSSPRSSNTAGSTPSSTRAGTWPIPPAIPSKSEHYLWNGNGLLIPDPARFPSAANGAGFKPLADWLHAQGLKFGIHIVRGIPRQVVAANLPIAGTSFHAADAADTTSPCPWDEGNWGIKDNAAGQAYYDSMLQLYASWGLDFLKVDCISDHPYRPTEIRQIAEAIRKSGRPIVLSAFRPAPPRSTTPPKSQSTRRCGASPTITGMAGPSRTSPAREFPFGTARTTSTASRKWFPYTGPGNWPDADMLPEGWLGPTPVGATRASRA